MFENNDFKMKKKKNLRPYSLTVLYLLLFTFVLPPVSAQKKSLKEFSVYGAGGIASFLQKNATLGYSFDAGVGFTGFFSPQWGIHTGVGMGFYKVKANAENIESFVPAQTDCANNRYDLNSKIERYYETQNPVFLSIPVMLQFQTKQNQSKYSKKNKEIDFYAMGGVKVMFLLKNSYTSAVTSLYNIGYYPDIDNYSTNSAVADPNAPLGNIEGCEVKGTLGFGFMAMIALESGVKWRLGNSAYLYTGVYFDCGLNDPNKNYRNLSSNYTSHEDLQNLTLVSFSDKINVWTLGFKLRLAFYKPQTSISCPAYR